MFFTDDAIKSPSVTARSSSEFSPSAQVAIAANCSVMNLLCKRSMKSSERRNKASNISNEWRGLRTPCCRADSVAQNRRVNPKSFFGELKRRNVYKVAIAYAVVGWLLTQVATQVFPFFEIPNWGIRLVVLIIVIGFPIAIIIVWAFELTPEGLKRTEVADELPKKSVRSRTWVFVIIIAAALSVGLFF